MRKHAVLIATVAAVFAVATFNVQAAPFAPVKVGVDAPRIENCCQMRPRPTSRTERLLRPQLTWLKRVAAGPPAALRIL